MNLAVSIVLLLLATAINSGSVYMAKKKHTRTGEQGSYRALATHAFLLAIFWGAFLAWVAWSYTSYVPSVGPGLLLGLLITALGSVLVRAGEQTLGYGAYINANIFLKTKQVRTPHSWAYKVTNNPMYTGFSVQLVGLAAAFHEIDLVLIAGCLFLCLNVFLSRIEKVA